MSITPAAFRSHLMQQFAAAAGRQSRPPLVMAHMVTTRTTADAVESVGSTAATTAATMAATTAVGTTTTTAGVNRASSPASAAAIYERGAIGQTTVDAFSPPPSPPHLNHRTSNRHQRRHHHRHHHPSSQASDGSAHRRRRGFGPDMERSDHRAARPLPYAASSAVAGDGTTRAAPTVSMARTYRSISYPSLSSSSSSSPLSSRRTFASIGDDGVPRYSDVRDEASVNDDDNENDNEIEENYNDNDNDDDDDDNDSTGPLPPSKEAAYLQSFVLSRRTISNFIPPGRNGVGDDVDENNNGNDVYDVVDIRSALTRAVLCAMSAPNHRRTEPFTFRRLLSPSDSTDRLSDIAYHVSINTMTSKSRGSESSIRAEAKRKADRWKFIPAFLVATVGGQPSQTMARRLKSGSEGQGDDVDVDVGVNLDVASGDNNGRRDERQVEDEDDDSDDDKYDKSLLSNDESCYEPQPIVPPVTERQLEDYASACAAIQNVLLSLHSEGIGSKWATGPVIRTLAFRNLIGVKDDEAVVALIMAGVPKRVPKIKEKKIASGRRWRRKLADDVLRDV